MESLLLLTWKNITWRELNFSQIKSTFSASFLFFFIMESCMKSDKTDTKNHSNSDSKYFGLTKQTSEVCIVIKITR